MADATASGGAAGATATTPPPSSTPAAAAASRGFGGWFGGLLHEVQGGLSEFVAVVSHDTREQAEKVEKQIEAALHERSVPPTQLASGLLQSVTRGIGRLLADESTESAGPSAANSPARAQVQYVIKGPRQRPRNAVLTQPRPFTCSRGHSSDRYRTELEAMRRDPATYTEEPSPSDEWTQFRSTFRLSDHSQEVSRLLANHSAMRSVHGRLVPAAVTQEQFWERYFFHVHLLDRDEQRRRELLEGVSGQRCHWRVRSTA